MIPIWYQMNTNFSPFKVYKFTNPSHLVGEFMFNLRKMKDSGSAGMVGAVISVLVTVVIGLIVYYKIAASINGLPAAGVTAAANVNTTANTVFTLAPIESFWA